ncbi:MAG: ATP-binding protein [Deltaproteobacteria bacterium]|nr:ATP-binding protein [Deltaproteobacteria bacterium]
MSTDAVEAAVHATDLELPVVDGGYPSQVQLVRDQLQVVRKQLRLLSEQSMALTLEPRVGNRWRSEIVAELAEIDRRVRATPSASAFPLIQLCERFSLTKTELRILWLMIAHEVCAHSRKMLRALATEEVLDPTSDVICRAVYAGGIGPRAAHELSDAGAMLRFALLECMDDSRTPFHRRTWKLSPRVTRLVHGVLDLDPTLKPIARIGDVRSNDALELSENAATEVTRALDRGAFTLVHGGVGTGRRSLLRNSAHARGWRVLEIDGHAIARTLDAARQQLQCIARECRLLDLTPLIASMDALDASGEVPDRIELVEEVLSGSVMATANRLIARRWKRAPVGVRLEPLRGAQHARLWRRALPMASQADAEILSAMYPLAPAMIEAAGRSAIEQCGDERMSPEHVEAGLRVALDERLAGLATPVQVTQTWSDLVLSEDQRAAVAELVARVRGRRRVFEEWGFGNKVGRGIGVSALFSGPPGTGKTMTAGLVARELRVELYQVDTSRIVSKWIGETQKNLAALFDAAEAGGAVLLFDEADALFARRTEVRTSNDRHANQEVDYLLQRLESYRGMCILTTNHESAIDEAFRRRISVHVRFQLPDADERLLLWQSMIPDAAPRAEDLRLEDLARRFAMSGGYIRNAALRAAFVAADEDCAIDHSRLARAALLEYEALGKIATRQ